MYSLEKAALALLVVLAGCGGQVGDAVAPLAAGDTRVDMAVAPVQVEAAALDAAPLLQAPPWPRAGLTAAELAVVVIEGDASSEAIGQAYLRQRGVPQANLVRVPLPVGTALVSDVDFARARLRFEQQVPAGVQASVLAFAQPSRVVGARCSMSITSAMAFGYDAAWCGGCAATRASPYYDSESTRPFNDLGVRPSMMLPAATLDEAQVLIARGVAADLGQAATRALLVRTNDEARSVRHTDMQALAVAWTGHVAMQMNYVDAQSMPLPGVDDGQGGLMFYFTGGQRIPGIASHAWLPGAVADHLTSYAGRLPTAEGQMPATAWIAAGATASYGTVEEPCNHVEKFPRVSVLVEHYLRGATVIEAYWKSVAWPGQGLFIGEPLARPFADPAATGIDARGLWLATRSFRRGAAYRLQWQAGDAQAWQDVATVTGGAPVPAEVRMALPAARGRLRWLGPCAAAGASDCELTRSP